MEVEGLDVPPLMTSSYPALPDLTPPPPPLPLKLLLLPGPEDGPALGGR